MNKNDLLALKSKVISNIYAYEEEIWLNFALGREIETHAKANRIVMSLAAEIDKMFDEVMPDE